MIKKIETNIEKLQIKSSPCFYGPMHEIKNQSIIQDMVDTAEANKDNCLGLAANQIGEYSRIILIDLNGIWVVMVNPSFTPVRSAGRRRYKEGCLSFPETMFKNRPIHKRFRKIHVTYHLVTGRKERITLTEGDASCVQHEIDHLNGKTI